MQTRLIETEEQLEDVLSTPCSADIEMMRRIRGDILILGAGGKMGLSLALRARRAAQASGAPRRVLAVSRFSSSEARQRFERAGVETIACDLLDSEQLSRLPLCQNVLFLAGRKFGSTGRPDLTWAINTVLPARAAEYFRTSRIVIFSTGNVYPPVTAASGGCREMNGTAPVGEYAQSCLGRERVFEYFSNEYGTPCVLFRLNYAVDLRYGVLVDIAHRVRDGEPVSLGVAYFNCIWQGDANSYALRSLDYCQSPPKTLNITGPEIIFVRQAAEFYADRFGRQAILEGEEGKTALLSDASTCHALMGPPQVSIEELMEWVAHWVERGGRSLNKPTKFEVTNGQF